MNENSVNPRISLGPNPNIAVHKRHRQLQILKIPDNQEVTKTPIVMSDTPKTELTTGAPPGAEVEEIEEEVADDNKETKESRVGSKLSELTTKRVIMLTLLLIIVVPLLTADYYFDFERSYIYGAELLGNLSSTTFYIPYEPLDTNHVNYTLNKK